MVKNLNWDSVPLECLRDQSLDHIVQLAWMSVCDVDIQMYIVTEGKDHDHVAAKLSIAKHKIALWFLFECKQNDNKTK